MMRSIDILYPRCVKLHSTFETRSGFSDPLLLRKIRIDRLVDPASRQPSFSRLVECVKERVASSLLKEALGEHKMTLSYKDSEGDFILIDSTEALRDALADADDNGSVKLNLGLPEKEVRVRLRRSIDGLCRVLHINRIAADDEGARWSYNKLVELTRATYGIDCRLALTYNSDQDQGMTLLLDDADLTGAIARCSSGTLEVCVETLLEQQGAMPCYIKLRINQSHQMRLINGKSLMMKESPLAVLRSEAAEMCKVGTACIELLFVHADGLHYTLRKEADLETSFTCAQGNDVVEIVVNIEANEHISRSESEKADEEIVVNVGLANAIADKDENHHSLELPSDECHQSIELSSTEALNSATNEDESQVGQEIVAKEQDYQDIAVGEAKQDNVIAPPLYPSTFSLSLSNQENSQVHQFDTGLVCAGGTPSCDALLKLAAGVYNVSASRISLALLKEDEDNDEGSGTIISDDCAMAEALQARSNSDIKIRVSLTKPASINMSVAGQDHSLCVTGGVSFAALKVMASASLLPVDGAAWQWKVPVAPRLFNGKAEIDSDDSLLIVLHNCAGEQAEIVVEPGKDDVILPLASAARSGSHCKLVDSEPQSIEVWHRNDAVSWCLHGMKEGSYRAVVALGHSSSSASRLSCFAGVADEGSNADQLRATLPTVYFNGTCSYTNFESFSCGPFPVKGLSSQTFVVMVANYSFNLGAAVELRYVGPIEE